MNDTNVVANEETLIVKDRVAATATVGYVAMAITFWMIGMLMAGWYVPGMIGTAGTNALSTSATLGVGFGVIYAVGSLLLVIIGILTMVYGRSLDAIIFLSMSGLLFSLHQGQLGALTGAGVAPSFYAWYAICWAVFFFYVWISSFRAGGARMLFLLGFWLAALAEAISGWTGSEGLRILSGYLLLATSILAFIVSAMEVIAFSPQIFHHRTLTTENRLAHP